jgi:hypothetical protein
MPNPLAQEVRPPTSSWRVTCFNGVLLLDVRFEVFTAVTMTNGVFLNVTSCGS